jgi:hypothetical protein
MQTRDEPDRRDLEREFSPVWEFFVGVNGLPYGRQPRQSPSVTLRGEDWRDLRDQILRYLGRR